MGPAAREPLGRTGLADDDRFRTNAGRVAHRAVLDAALTDWCARHGLDDIQDRADAAGIGNARYNTPREVLPHPQLAARDRRREIDTPAGPVPALLPPVIEGYAPPMGAVPALGQQTDAVLAELGLSEGEFAALRERARRRPPRTGRPQSRRPPPALRGEGDRPSARGMRRRGHRTGGLRGAGGGRTGHHGPPAELGTGLIPGAGGTVSLPAPIGRHRTAYPARSGIPLGATEAFARGLVDAIAPDSGA